MYSGKIHVCRHVLYILVIIYGITSQICQMSMLYMSTKISNYLRIKNLSKISSIKYEYKNQI